MKKKFKKDRNIIQIIIYSVLLVIVVLIALFFFMLLGLAASFFVSEPLEPGNVALIHIKGIILTEEGSGFIDESIASSTEIVEDIHSAEDDDSIQAILIEIDSPGGAAVASEEIAYAIKNAEKPTIAVIREAGASGAYWAASAADVIFASRMSVTGSIGVIASYLEFSGLMEDYNVSYERLVAGRYKDTGTPFKKLTSEERKKLQKHIDTVHGYFIESVAENRNLSEEKVREFADGFIMIGAEAQENGFVDYIGNRQDAISFIEKEMNITAEVVEYAAEPSLLDLLLSISDERFYQVGRGIGSSISSDADSRRISILT